MQNLEKSCQHLYSFIVTDNAWLIIKTNCEVFKTNLPTQFLWFESHCVKGQQPKGNLKNIYFHLTLSTGE